MPKGAVLYVAVVDCPSDGFRSRREYGDYSAFLGESRDEVIQRALRAREDWGREVYRVLVGILDCEAREPVLRGRAVGRAGGAVKAGRTLQELAAEIERQSASKRDFIVDTCEHLTMLTTTDGSELHIA